MINKPTTKNGQRIDNVMFALVEKLRNAKMTHTSDVKEAKDGSNKQGTH